MYTMFGNMKNSCSSYYIKLILYFLFSMYECTVVIVCLGLIKLMINHAIFLLMNFIIAKIFRSVSTLMKCCNPN